MSASFKTPFFFTPDPGNNSFPNSHTNAILVRKFSSSLCDCLLRCSQLDVLSKTLLIDYTKIETGLHFKDMLN